jgi:hypothetical protein
MHDELAGELPRAFFADGIGAARMANQRAIGHQPARIGHLLFQLRMLVLERFDVAGEILELRQDAADFAKRLGEIVNGNCQRRGREQHACAFADDGER